MNKKVVTYSLLAHINNASTNQSNFDQIFIPLVKRCLAKITSNGVFKGDDINDIRKPLEELYGLDMPVPVLQGILGKIEKELNTPEKTVVVFYKDGSFTINKYIFSDYEEEVEKKEVELRNLESIYTSFAAAEGRNVEGQSLYDFIEAHKSTLGRYISKRYPSPAKDNTLPARFVNFLEQLPGHYQILQGVYIGSIISTFLEYHPNIIHKEVELVLDTNFIISLVDLNTPIATENCQRLLKIATKLGYRFSVLNITLREIDQLLKAKVDYFDQAFLARMVDPEDIYNACVRRNLSKTDLDKIRANISTTLQGLKIQLVPNTDKYQNRAKHSDEYEKLKAVRSSAFAALHDATCIDYVKEKRGKKIYDFDKVNCWFVNNSSSRAQLYTNGNQPFQIKAEELLNLLWLTSPMVKNAISGQEVGAIGLSRLVSATLDDSMPSSATIRNLDENICKYVKDVIDDSDIVRISKAIAERTISNLEGLNELAEKKSPEFIAKLQQIAEQEKNREKRLKAMMEYELQKVKEKKSKLDKAVGRIDQERSIMTATVQSIESKYSDIVETNMGLVEHLQRLKKEKIEVENKDRKTKRDEFIRKKIVEWRMKAVRILVLCFLPIITIVLWAYYQNEWNGVMAKKMLTDFSDNLLYSLLFWLFTLLFTGLVIKLLSDRLNPSSVKAYKTDIELPAELQDVPVEMFDL